VTGMTLRDFVKADQGDQGCGAPGKRGWHRESIRDKNQTTRAVSIVESGRPQRKKTGLPSRMKESETRI